MTNLQLFLAMGVPVIFNGLLFVMLLTKVNHLETSSTRTLICWGES